MKRCVCLHGHFYQPPRENPWLDAIEVQDSAAPYHDWNERVTAECYAPNGRARRLDDKRRILDIVNNYERISFNFGPTLLAWLERHAPETYKDVLEADRRSRKRFSGHGSALAQAYNHIIMPLASPRDRRTQIQWGIADFRRRFERDPEGMWLPETAVDTDTLEALAESGIRFTVLAPSQAARVKRAGSAAWTDVSGGRIDGTRPYRCALPSGRSIALFFYDGPVSMGVAFEGLLNRGESLAARLAERFGEDGENQLVHIATDGETYGHHHRFGEMALAQALHILEKDPNIRLTNYGEYLDRFPPVDAVEIVENSSWSCAHGVERWRSDCGCRTGGDPRWNQSWRAPLRRALDGLRDRLATLFEREAGPLLQDPWAARDDYVAVVLDLSSDTRNRFLAEQAGRQLAPAERVQALRLLEMQRHSMLMATSCGWFFNDLAGIETIQILRYAARAVELAESVTGESLEPGFLDELSLARSNEPAAGTGRNIYEKEVRPRRVDLRRVAVHYVLSAPFEHYDAVSDLFSFRVSRESWDEAAVGERSIAAGRVSVSSTHTEEKERFEFARLRLADQDTVAGLKTIASEVGETDSPTVAELEQCLQHDGAEEARRCLSDRYGELESLGALFADERRKILSLAIEKTLHEAEAAYARIYETHGGLMRYLAEVEHPQPEVFRYASRVVLGGNLRAALRDDALPLERIRGLVDEAHAAGLGFDVDLYRLLYERMLEGALEGLLSQPGDVARLSRVAEAAELAAAMPFRVDLWRAQNLFDRLRSSSVAPRAGRPNREEGDAANWESFRRLGEALFFRMDDPPDRA